MVEGNVNTLYCYQTCAINRSAVLFLQQNGHILLASRERVTSITSESALGILWRDISVSLLLQIRGIYKVLIRGIEVSPTIWIKHKDNGP
jgi:hypothetical protein